MILTPIPYFLVLAGLHTARRSKDKKLKIAELVIPHR